MTDHFDQREDLYNAKKGVHRIDPASRIDDNAALKTIAGRIQSLSYTDMLALAKHFDAVIASSASDLTISGMADVLLNVSKRILGSKAEKPKTTCR